MNIGEDRARAKRRAAMAANIGAVAIIAIMGFFAFMIMAMMTSCGHIRLPDRSKCVIPWEQRKDCINERQCGPEEVCARRGRTIGKCTLIDCCNPWRNGPRLMHGADWCTHEEMILDKDPDIDYND